MNRKDTLREWNSATLDAMVTLYDFLTTLTEWAANDHNLDPTDFDRELANLDSAGLLHDWADRNPAGGGLDSLYEALTGQPPGDESLPLHQPTSKQDHQIPQGVTTP